MANLPIIDISAFFTDDEQLKRETALKLRKVCSEIGFFYLTGHGIPQDMVDEAHKQAREFFKLPLEVKNEISVQNSPHFRGYQALGENITRKKRDWHEV
jgi:isopenicillin N synthase-like dioxygenase